MIWTAGGTKTNTIATITISEFRLYEPRHEKNLLFAYINAKTKSQIRCAVQVTAQLISVLVFATEIIQVYRTPKTGFLATRLIFNLNYKKPLQGGLHQLAASVCGWESLVGLRQFID